MRHDALPQSNLFSWENNPSYAGVFILKYIFPFATSTIKHHKDYICDLLTALITHNKQVVAEIAALCEQK